MASSVGELLLLILLTLYFCGRTYAQRCPPECLCSPPDNSVYCSDQRLTSLPVNIPRYVSILSLHRNKIKTLGRGQFRSLTNLNTLELSANEISEIEPGTFIGLGDLRTLELNNNRLTSIDGAIFQGLTRLNNLGLRNNPLYCLPKYAFSYVPSLKFLDLGRLFKLQAISKNAFAGLKNLVYLNMTECNLVTVPHLKHLESLENLDLSRNSIDKLETDNLAELKGLGSLRMPSNLLSEIEQDSFEDLGSLRELDLSDNYLTILPFGLFSNMRALTKVNLGGNPWNCTCEVTWLVTWLRRKTRSDPTRESCGRCQSPWRFRGKLLCDVPVTKLKCSPPQITDVPRALNVTAGGNATLQCNTGDSKETAVNWISPNGTMIRKGSFKLKVKFSGGQSLNFARVSTSDAGIYRCVARNSAGTTTLDTILNVTGSVLPIFRATEIPINGEEPEDDNLCQRAFDKATSTVSGDSQITWQRDSKPTPGRTNETFKTAEEPLPTVFEPGFDMTKNTDKHSSKVDHQKYIIASIVSVISFGLLVWLVFFLLLRWDFCCPASRFLAKRREHRTKAQKDDDHYRTRCCGLRCCLHPPDKDAPIEIPEPLQGYPALELTKLEQGKLNTIEVYSQAELIKDTKEFVDVDSLKSGLDIDCVKIKDTDLRQLKLHTPEKIVSIQREKTLESFHPITSSDIEHSRTLHKSPGTSKHIYTPVKIPDFHRNITDVYIIRKDPDSSCIVPQVLDASVKETGV
ncbi:PREDICTED: leucine-rich repeat-containing protein 4C-like [Branchiostoma belcheri]|uniref:Leucine-rich repeat-containing protein 4C-like n=1 Tax=Branchiostoma belcheri TaxID=7741 RepID=A0A6P4ZUH1_BRABE|nr:PREDICTED: leucine-rich repeat-containing protein 4C-like [Branchiostoma belcheri]